MAIDPICGMTVDEEAAAGTLSDAGTVYYFCSTDCLNQFRLPKTLEPMTIDGSASYGNYFKLSGEGPYRVQIEIRRPEIPNAIRAEFEYRPRD